MKAKKKIYTEDDLIFALESAADFLEMEEWPENDGGAQVAAYHEAAKRLRRMADRIINKKPPKIDVNAMAKRVLQDFYQK